MRRLRWTAQSSADLMAIQRYYREIDFALGEALFFRVVEAPKPLLERPGLGSPPGGRGERKWRVRQTPFALLHRILRDGTLVIARARHSSRDWSRK